MFLRYHNCNFVPKGEIAITWHDPPFNTIPGVNIRNPIGTLFSVAFISIIKKRVCTNFNENQIDFLLLFELVFILIYNKSFNFDFILKVKAEMASLCCIRCQNDRTRKKEYKKYFETTEVINGIKYYVQCNDVYMPNRNMFSFKYDSITRTLHLP